MKKLIQSKPTTSQQSIHVQDLAILRDFLNANSKQIGGVDNLGSFIDVVGINNDVGILLEETFLIVERGIQEDRWPGKDRQIYKGPKKEDIFDYPYNAFDDLPDEYPEEPASSDYGIYLAVKTYACNPQMTCELCEGTGKCSICEGRGKTVCRSCQGTGKKDARDGNYANGKPKYRKVACSACDGFKKVNCRTCNGSKRCKRCDGEGKVTCRRCGGTSNYQDVTYVHTTYRSSSAVKMSKNLQDFTDVLGVAEGKVVFDDDLVEWESASSMLFDKRNDAIELNRHFLEFANNLDVDAGLVENQKLARVRAKFANIPITSVDYTFEDKEYTLFIVGENHLVCYEDIPKHHIHRAGVFTRFVNLFTKNKRQMAFLYIAAYMFNSDGAMDIRELTLLDTLLKEVLPVEADRQQFINEYCKELSFDDIEPFVKSVKNDPRAVVFAWQCVLQDRKIQGSEIEAFRVLADYCKIDSANLDRLKQKAEKFGTLTNSQLIAEYFK